MTTSTLFHTQGIRGFKYVKTHRKNGTEYYYVRSSATHLSCPCCRSAQTAIVNTGKVREIRGLHVGFKKTIFRVHVRRVLCSDCGRCPQEPIAFCAGPYVRYTKWLAQYVLGLRKEMSISAVAHLTGLHWQSVKEIEKVYLLKKHKKPSLAKVQYLGIDEVYLGRTLGYITVVREPDERRGFVHRQRQGRRCAPSLPGAHPIQSQTDQSRHHGHVQCL